VSSPSLRRSVVLVVSALLALAACTGDGGAEDASVTASPGNTGNTGVRFATTGGDVFAWDQHLTGTGECASVDILVDGEPVDAGATVTTDGFEATVPVAEGDQSVVARCTGDDGQTSDSEPITLTGRLTARPTARIEVSVKGDAVTLDGRSSEATEPDGAEVKSYAWSEGDDVQGNPEPIELHDGKPLDGASDPVVELRTPSKDGEYYVWLTVTDAQGREDRAGSYFVVEDGRPREVDLMTEHPAWIDAATVYAPIPQLWGNRGFKEVTDHLEYLKDLGVDALWLWPPVTQRALGEQYAITDYFSIDPEWGPGKDLKELVDKAHELGLRVLFDFVPNHSAIQHPYAREVDKLGTASHYYDFYDHDEQGNFTHYFDWDNLPNLNYDNPEVRRMMTEAMTYWIREYDIDGFRVDASWAIKKRDPDYWPEWRTELKRVKPDLLLLSESPAADPYYFSNGFDVAFDWWQRDLGQWAWKNAFEFPEAVSDFIVPALTNSGKGWSKDTLILRFLNNNDTDVRFVDQFGPGTTKVASAMEFTVPGVPLMFAGDEIGASYLPYSNLTPIKWKDEYGLDPWYRDLIRTRDELPSLRSREMTVLETDNGAVVAYVRPASDGGDPVLVLLNYGGKTNVRLTDVPELAPFTGTLKDALTGDLVRLDGTAGSFGVSLDKEQVRILTPEAGA
jgi:cyclomaltodextrinase